MCEIPIFYVSTNHDTRLLADRVAGQLRAHRVDSRPVAMISEEASHIDWSRVRASVLASSSDSGSFEGEAAAFAHAFHAELSALPCLVVPVTGEHRFGHIDQSVDELAYDLWSRCLPAA